MIKQLFIGVVCVSSMLGCGASTTPSTTAPEAPLACPPLRSGSDILGIATRPLTLAYVNLNTYWEAEHTIGNGPSFTHQFPAPLARTPSLTQCSLDAWQSEVDALGDTVFGMYPLRQLLIDWSRVDTFHPHAVSLEFVIQDATHAELRLYSDDNCDGVPQIATLAVHVTPEGELNRGDIEISCPADVLASDARVVDPDMSSWTYGPRAVHETVPVQASVTCAAPRQINALERREAATPEIIKALETLGRINDRWRQRRQLPDGNIGWPVLSNEAMARLPMSPPCDRQQWIESLRAASGAELDEETLREIAETEHPFSLEVVVEDPTHLEVRLYTDTDCDGVYQITRVPAYALSRHQILPEDTLTIECPGE